ncbi:tRNA lysidine(34) synthetase TilS [endosymbiont GvMRE of Glomus versiforme]|uniref:tRNA lysidine(34) synthetase TilS n=1 Tax=endosymbiont GvMRE of Glomus versiforme TaxID=2039283 RepID=UPI000EE2A5E0|nr:tRNA lysidine(34) synthetase TilS [endosymbiont GvMRE of Glomus versiforme]RHZ36512.1 tRNA(Ile)-lysidine synthase [endosymbiont GvMRE of Glomus versiforme]
MFNEKILNKKLTYILGISGGPDSMFLLDKMYLLGFNFVVAHVNYHKRAESNQDEELVKKYCQKWNLPFFAYQVQPQEYSQVKNFQAWARKKRYDFFQQLAQQKQTKYIIVAHHLDDHLETYLLQKEKKTLVENWGLAPKIPWQNKKKSIYILRPLLSLSKEQICQYLHQNNIPYIIDKTNYLPIYQRNITRQKLIDFPLKKKELLKEIQLKNQELQKTKLLLKKQIKEVIFNSSLNLEIWQTNSPELKLRLLYYWVNKNTNNAFVSRKKPIWPEINKQLISKKRKINIILSKDYQISKNFPWAVLKKELSFSK